MSAGTSFIVFRVLGCVFGWFRHSWCRVRRVAVRRCLERRGRLSLRLAFRLRLRRCDLRAVSFGAGRLSARAFAISAIEPSSSRALSSAMFARGV